MKIIFSDHARLKIFQRKLSRQKALETVAHPDFIQQGYNGREARFKNFGKNYLKAITVIEKDALVVVTVHWIAGARIQE